MSESMIRLRGLGKRYDAFVALEDLSIDVMAGELFGLLGPNGAGKTTTLNILVGLLSPSNGSVEVGGVDLLRFPSAAKRSMGFVPDRPYLPDKLTGREVMQLFAALYDVPRERSDVEAERLLELFGLAHKADALVDGYSHGMRQRLALAATLIHDPKVLIVDEPLVGLDPQGARLFKDLVRARCDAGKTVVMSTHALDVAEELCDRVAIVHRGRLRAVGTVGEIKQGSEGSLEDVFLALTQSAAGDG